MITCTSTECDDDGEPYEPQEFADLDALAAELYCSAADEYRQAVLSALRSGQAVVRIANGSDWDTYAVTEQKMGRRLRHAHAESDDDRTERLVNAHD